MDVRRFLHVALALMVLAASACVAEPEPVLPEHAVQSHRGVWIGKSHHDTIGTVSVHRADGEALILIEDNFTMPPVPGAIVALGMNGYQPRALVGEVRRARGRQVYRIPEDLSMTDYNEIWLWDSVRDLPVGLARLRGI